MPKSFLLCPFCKNPLDAISTNFKHKDATCKPCGYSLSGGCEHKETHIIEVGLIEKNPVNVCKVCNKILP